MSYSRSSIYAGEQLQVSDFATYQRNAAKTDWWWVADAYGTLPASGGFYSGLAVTGGNGNLSVNVGVGRLYQLQTTDPSAWIDGTTDATQYVMAAPQVASTVLGPGSPFQFTAPGTAGQSIVYLIEAQVQVLDTATVNEPFYNATTPSNPTLILKSPNRTNTLAYQLKAGVAATTGTQVAPSVDAGWVPIANVTVANGQTTIVNANIAVSTYPLFTGFVLNSGQTSVLLNPSVAQSGTINLSNTTVLYNEGITLVGGLQSNIANLIPDSNLTIVAPAPPTALNTSNPLTTGGNLAQSTNYYFKVTSSNANAESLGSAELLYTTPASGTSTNQITLNWTSPTGQTVAKVYAGTATGQENLMATLGNVSTYAVTAAIPVGNNPPPIAAGSISDWLLAGANVSPNTGGGNAGSNAIQFAGTGAASGTQTATGPTVQAISGQPYTFGIYVSGAANISSGSMTVGLVQAGTNTFVGTPITVNSATANGRVTYTVTNPTTPLQVYITSNNCTITNATNVLFSQPMLNPGSTAQTYLINTPGTFLLNTNGGLQTDYLSVTGQSTVVNTNPNTSMSLAGAISHTGGHAGTQADPYPQSQINAALFGGKPPSAYALASGNYITVYAGAPTLATGNAGITGTLQANIFQSNIATGTAPFTVASTTVVANLNASQLAGFVPGNAANQIPLSNSTLCTNLNAQFLNGVPGSGYQLAGSYAVLNATNIGSFATTLSIAVTGGTGSNQAVMNYGATNSFGVNSGLQTAYIQSVNYPLGLIAPQVETNGPLYVGGSAATATRYGLYAQDLNVKGIVRSGMVPYRVTYSSSSTYPTPGTGTDLGYTIAPNGYLPISFDEASTGSFSVGYRTLVTVNATTTITINAIGIGACAVYLDGVSKLSRGANGDGVASVSLSLSSGQHTIDLVFGAANMAISYYTGSSREYFGGSLTFFGWLPIVSGSMAPTVTALAPG